MSRVDGVVTEPRPPQTRACVLTHSVPHIIDSLKIRKTLSGCSGACLAIHCCFVDVVLELRVPPSFPPSGSNDVTPPSLSRVPVAPVPCYQQIPWAPLGVRWKKFYWEKEWK